MFERITDLKVEGDKDEGEGCCLMLGICELPTTTISHVGGPGSYCFLSLIILSIVLDKEMILFSYSAFEFLV